MLDEVGRADDGNLQPVAVDLRGDLVPLPVPHLGNARYAWQPILGEYKMALQKTSLPNGSLFLTNLPGGILKIIASFRAVLILIGRMPRSMVYGARGSLHCPRTRRFSAAVRRLRRLRTTCFAVKVGIAVQAGFAIQKEWKILSRRLGILVGLVIAAHDDALLAVEAFEPLRIGKYAVQVVGETGVT